MTRRGTKQLAVCPARSGQCSHPDICASHGCAAIEAQRNAERGLQAGRDAEAQKVALRLAALTGRLCAALEWCVEHDGECLSDNPHQFGYARGLLAEARRMPGASAEGKP